MFFLNFYFDFHKPFEELDRHARGGWLQKCSNNRACKRSWLNMFLNMHHMISRDIF